MCSNSASRRRSALTPSRIRSYASERRRAKPENSDAGELPCRACIGQKRGNPIILPLCEVGFTIPRRLADMIKRVGATTTEARSGTRRTAVRPVAYGR